MAAREIPGLATVLDLIDDGAMAPAAAWCERRGVDYIYQLKELGDDGEIEAFMNAAGINDFQKKLVKKRIMELPRPPPSHSLSPGTDGAAPPAPAPAPPPAPSPTTKRAPPPRTSDATLCSPPKKTRQEEEEDDEPVFLAVKSEQDRTELARTRAVMTGDVIDIDDDGRRILRRSRANARRAAGRRRRQSPQALRSRSTSAPFSRACALRRTSATV